jgi:hypothetical protein
MNETTALARTSLIPESRPSGEDDVAFVGFAFSGALADPAARRTPADRPVMRSTAARRSTWFMEYVEGKPIDEYCNANAKEFLPGAASAAGADVAKHAQGWLVETTALDAPPARIAALSRNPDTAAMCVH